MNLGIEYHTKINREELIEVTDLSLDDFNNIDCYSKKSNANSVNKFNFYNELLVVKLEAPESVDDNIKSILDGFEICPPNNEVLENVNAFFQNENILWLSELNDSNIIWNKRLQQFENNDIKSSVTLYFLYSRTTNNCYIVLDQINI